MNEASDAALPLWAQHAIWIAGQPEVMMVLAGLLLASLFLVARRRFVRDPVSVLFLVLSVAGALMIAGLGQVMDSAALYQDTYYNAARNSFLAALLVITLAFWALYRWFRAIVGVRYNRVLGGIHWVAWSASVALLIWPGLSLEAGMPQRYVEYGDVFVRYQTLQMIGYFVTLISVLAFAICMGEAIYRRTKTGKEPPETHDRAVRHF
ncbi:hypothetical protein [uncultured Hyphomonas sp.]|uniref:hypothetical protein n=1 Tax=uncultured Hyphomonas sp. TaxID=225298 RepID=UPI0026020662|nr:hypothetical protein [uncultured Hyphomonas sp.]|tara:strand:- start:13 stop:636 length:624 start_codon:yes stop_codon:yes gene_type:complete